jgi:acetyltransferase-like isoleucine patch superfamily enzyme
LLLPFTVRIRATASRAHVSLSVGRRVSIGPRLRVSVDRRSRTVLHLGDDARIGGECTIRLSGGEVRLERGCVLGDGGLVETASGEIVVGEAAVLGPGGVLRAGGGSIRIDKGVRADPEVVVHAAIGAPVRVEAGATLGARVVVVPGATVAAGAVIPADGVVGGPPQADTRR